MGTSKTCLHVLSKTLKLPLFHSFKDLTAMKNFDLDPAFIQDTEQRPKLGSADPVTVELPVIDLSSPSTINTVSQIGLTCKDWVFFFFFFQIINHGGPLELVAKAEDVGRRFFKLPAEEKRKARRDKDNAMGYHKAEPTKNIRDWKEVFDFLVEDRTVVPASPEPDDHEFRTLVNQWPLNPPEFSARRGRHEDARAFDHQWIPVTPTLNAFIVNVGDIIQVCSNEKYESVEHGVVVNSVKERFSIPFFFFPEHQVMVKPFEEILNNGDLPRYKEYNWGKFLARRFRSDFKKRPEENIQIQHFRIE